MIKDGHSACRKRKKKKSCQDYRLSVIRAFLEACIFTVHKDDEQLSI